jgi:CubicO group peptidase (beta-lactamase class C family)
MKLLLTFTSIIISSFAYLLIEPYNLSPITTKPFSFSKSEKHFEPDTLKNCNKKRDSILNAAIKSKDFIGISTGIYIENCKPWLATAGFLNKRRKQIPNKQSLFRIASISKPMTAVAIMQLHEKKKVDLDIPIQTYLPEFPKKEKGDITIRQLLQHRSGIPHYKSKLGIFHFKNYTSCIDALKRFKNRKLKFKPGTSFLYSSYGYTILGAIIEKVSGKSYQEYMNENIWVPAGMKNTCTEQKSIEYTNKANLYIKTFIGFVKSPKNNLSYTYSGGGIISTAKDMLKFGKAILENKLISISTTKLMIAISQQKPYEIEYALGWDVWSSLKHQRIIQHNGTQLGSSSFFRIYFDKKVVVVALANNLNSSKEVRKLSLNLADSFLKME